MTRQRIRTIQLSLAIAIFGACIGLSARSLRAQPALDSCEWIDDPGYCEDINGNCYARDGFCTDATHPQFCCCDVGWGC